MLHPLTLLSAGLLDELVGDPPSWPHPVRAYGWIIAQCDKARSCVTSSRHLRLLGVVLALGLPALGGAFVSGILGLARLVTPYTFPIEILLGAWMLAGKSLREAVKPVALALETGNLEEARRQVGFVVGRDTAHLDEPEIARAGLETLAESLCDGVVAPLFWFALCGLPGLWAFKAVSTLDSMVGHIEAPYTHFGWASARLDDVLNWIPARITAVIIALAGFSIKALQLALRDGGKTKSPNAGVVEAAFAGALGVQLGGTNYYDGVEKVGPKLGDPGRKLEASTLKKGLHLTARVNGLAVALGGLCLWLVSRM